jgi:hypothetical protein
MRETATAKVIVLNGRKMETNTPQTKTWYLVNNGEYSGWYSNRSLIQKLEVIRETDKTLFCKSTNEYYVKYHNGINRQKKVSKYDGTCYRTFEEAKAAATLVLQQRFAQLSQSYSALASAMLSLSAMKP